MYEHGGYSPCGFDVIENSGDSDVSVTVEIEDPEYETVFRNLKPHRNCYALLVHDDCDNPKLLEYESFRVVKDLSPSHRRLRYRTRNENKRVVATCGVMPTRRKACSLRKRRLRKKLGSGLGHSVDNSDDNEEYLRFVNQGPSDYGEVLRVYADSGSGCDRAVVAEETETRDMTEDFIAYLDLLQIEGEKESETAMDLVVLNEDELSSDRYLNTFVSSRVNHVYQKDVDSHCVWKVCDTNRSQFKEELIEILEKPYNSKEHRELKQEVELRRPIPRDIDRDGKKETCPSKRKLGKSYISLYTDFAKLYNSETRKQRSLNLLRGFFFWLKNISRDGAFKPWSDPSILKVLPRNDSKILYQSSDWCYQI